MEPLSPNDPLHTLLGKGRPVEPRPNFTHNVLRAIRQAPQSLSLGERIGSWLGQLSTPRVALAGAIAALALVALAGMALHEPAAPMPVVVERPPVVRQPSVQPALHEVSASMILAATAEYAPAATKRYDMNPVALLLAHEDTPALTDSELALLLY